MRNPRIYVDATLACDQMIATNKETSHYLAVVLRMSVGEQVMVFNGRGGSYQAEIVALSKKNVSLQILTFDPQDSISPLHTHIGLGMSLGDRMEYAIQKACELGLSELTPIISARSELKLKGERQQKKVARWQQVAISSCEQNGLNRVPVIHPPTPLEHWLQQTQAQCKLVLHHRQAQSLQSQTQAQSIAALVGPEGGLTEQEIDSALSAGFQALTLGPRVLRTETAPVVLLTGLQLLWGDL